LSAYEWNEPIRRGVRGFGRPYFARRVALSPDGQTLVIAKLNYTAPVGLWDMTTGKLRDKLDLQLASVHTAADQVDRIDHLGGRPLTGFVSSANGVVFSPDGQLIVTWSEDPFGKSTTDHVRVWDAATGRAITRLLIETPLGAGSVAFAPDGRTMATASKDGVLRLWEVATWSVRAEYRGHRDRITALAFGPDGKLYTGGLDTVVLGWNTQPRSHTKGTLAEAWEVLLKADAKAAFDAQGRFLGEPEKAVEWMKERVKPANAPDAARIKSLIAELDKDDFATREKATASLQELGPIATMALKEVVAKSPSLEAKRRAERLLQEITNGVVPPQELRALRAAALLEWIDTKEARAHLLELAKGAKEHRLTRDALATCKRKR
jgi:hypothetical protein